MYCRVDWVYEAPNRIGCRAAVRSEVDVAVLTREVLQDIIICNKKPDEARRYWFYGPHYEKKLKSVCVCAMCILMWAKMFSERAIKTANNKGRRTRWGRRILLFILALSVLLAVFIMYMNELVEHVIRLSTCWGYRTFVKLCIVLCI